MKQDEPRAGHRPGPAGGRDRTATAVRVLAHRLLHRADRLGRKPDPDAALRLADERLVPSPAGRRLVAERARALCLAALGERRPGGRLEGELRANVRVGLRQRDGGSRVVLIPSLVFRRESGAVAVVAMQEGGAEAAQARARRYRAAARVLFQRPVRAFIVLPDGTLADLPRRATTRSEPSAAPNPDSGCSPSDHPQSGRRRR